MIRHKTIPKSFHGELVTVQVRNRRALLACRPARGRKSRLATLSIRFRNPRLAEDFVERLHRHRPAGNDPVLVSVVRGRTGPAVTLTADSVTFVLQPDANA